MTFWVGFYETFRSPIVKLLSRHLPGQIKAIRKKDIITGAAAENRTRHILSTNLKCSSLGEKSFQQLRLLHFRLVSCLSILHILRPLDTFSSNLRFSWKSYTHRTPNAMLLL
jgi:hypothetical protein